MTACPWYALLGACALATSSAAQALYWTPVGSPHRTHAAALSCQVIFNHAGAPYVAFQDASTADLNSSLMGFDGSDWQYAGAPGGASEGRGWYNRLAVDGLERVYVATRDYGVDGRLSLRRWDPALGVWEPIGPPASSGNAHWTDVDLDPAGVPYVAYSDGDAPVADALTVRRFLDGAWETVGPQGLTGAPAVHTTLRCDPAGVPHVAYAGATDGYRVHVRRFVDDAWVPLGAPPVTPTGCLNCALAFDATGALYVAYLRPYYEIVVWRFECDTWTRLGDSAAGPDTPMLESEAWRQWLPLVVDACGRPVVGYQSVTEGLRCTVRRWQDGAWAVVGCAAFTPRESDYAGLALDAQGAPWVVYRDGPLGSSWTVARASSGPASFCTPRLSSQGCLPLVAYAGTPTLGGDDDFHLRAEGLAVGVVGYLVLSAGYDNVPLGSGTRCLALPLTRTGVSISSGPAGACAGVLDRELTHADLAALTGALGERVYAQWWYRDSAGPPLDSLGISDALAFTIVP